MKKIIMFLLIFICFVSFNSEVVAYEIDYDLEYYYVTYEFVNSNEYYVTYKFKPKNEISSVLYLCDDGIDLESVEYDVEEVNSLGSSYLKDMLEMEFTINENKEYFIKYKGFVKNDITTRYMLAVNPILDEKPRYHGSDSGSLKVEDFRLTIINSDYVNLTKDKFSNIHDLFLKEESGTFTLEGSIENNNVDKYYYARFTVYEDSNTVDTIILVSIIIICLITSVIAVLYYRKKILN